MKMSALRPILVLAPMAWMLGLATATALAGSRAVGVPAYAVSAAIYEIGSLLCHQLPARSFHVWGAQLPVCARCTGLYIGAAGAAIVATQLSAGLQRRVWNRARSLTLLGALPTAVTLIVEWFSGHTPGNWTRAAAGFPLGAIVMLIILASTALESAVEIH